MGAVWTSDPRGRCAVWWAGSASIRYRFATRTADFLGCGECGIVAVASTRIAGRHLGVINVRILDAAEAFLALQEPRDFAGESPAARQRRRELSWTPLWTPRPGSELTW